MDFRRRLAGIVEVVDRGGRRCLVPEGEMQQQLRLRHRGDVGGKGVMLMLLEMGGVSGRIDEDRVGAGGAGAGGWNEEETERERHHQPTLEGEPLLSLGGLHGEPPFWWPERSFALHSLD